MIKIPVVYISNGVEIELCDLDESSVYFLCRKKCLSYDKAASKCVITDAKQFINHCKKMGGVTAYKECLRYFKEVNLNV